MQDLYGGIEAGGTKFVCAVGSGPEDIRAEERFPTTSPDETISKAIQFFKKQTALQPIKALGIGSFGPIDPNPASPTFGYITATPKPGWSNTEIAGAFQRALNLPVGFDTDVNAAALGESMWGASRDLGNSIYLTIGTGIGGGVIVNGQILHGLVHPEMGHIRLPHNWQEDPYAGKCPFHGDCFEGLASGPSLAARWGRPAETLPLDHPAWALEAHYIALALNDFICTLSPERIIIGGGVMEQQHLFSLIREDVLKLLNGYIASPVMGTDLSTYIVPPDLGKRAGVLGSMALGMQFQ